MISVLPGLWEIIVPSIKVSGEGTLDWEINLGFSSQCIKVNGNFIQYEFLLDLQPQLII